MLRTQRCRFYAALAAGDDLNLIPGSFVTHDKKPELGSGEILSAYDGRIEIRFASGERTFMVALVTKHLKVTSEAPAKPEPKKRATKKKVAAAAAAPAAAK